MINIALRTEYSFKKCFGHIAETVEGCKESALGIADEDSTYGHIQFSKRCIAEGIKPIFGVRLRAPIAEKQRTGQQYWIFLARNDAGLKEIYGLVDKAYAGFFFFPRLTIQQISAISHDVVVIAPTVEWDMKIFSHIEAMDRADYLIDSPFNPSDKINSVAIQENFYPKEEDKPIYELLAGAQKRAEGYIPNFENRACPMHIVDASFFSKDSSANTRAIADDCNAEIQKAKMVKFSGGKNLRTLCKEGAERLGLQMNNTYLERVERELSMIEEKGYEDYFLLVADMLRYANKHMLVGPSRGSSAGSLVCYLTDITKIDPLKYDLLFERFIDINRFDLPDIDIDFPDSKRHMVIDYLHRKYGEDNVKNLANVNRLKAKSAIDLFGMGLSIPKGECDTVKNAMIERSAGDARNAMCIADTFNDTDPGKEFIANHPQMGLVSRIENHAQHAGKHAAGIIVSNEPLINYGGVNSRDGVIMLDKRDAEDINLLKIDCLGLTTLSILEDAAELSGKKRDFYYSLPLDDEATFKIFSDGRLNGIFQFEGQALKMLTKSIHVTEFDDLVAITALARPGALRSGGAAKFAKRKIGDEKPVYFGEKHQKITEPTMGIMVYQEQMMFLAKELADFSWMEISDMRKAASKSLGDDYFSKYEEKFIKNCQSFSGMTADEADAVWKDIQHAGSWIFNKSHAVAYSMLSYYTAYMKAHHQIEFYAASLNHARDDDSALRILRDGYENDGIRYTPVDPDLSEAKWTVVDGELLGGLCNIKGIAEKKAIDIIKRRKTGSYTPGMLRMLEDPKTNFDILFPTKHLWSDLFDDPQSMGLSLPPTEIRDIEEPGEYMVVGRLIDRNLNDLNEYNKVQKRGHKLDDNTLYLNIIIEDDHDSIMCSIGRYEYERLNGRKIAQEAKVGEEWYLIRGKMSGSWRGISVNEILNLNEWRKDNAESNTSK